jgi:hypothetical protein
MKTRHGFVSNSSSTSFTVLLKRDAAGVNYRVFDLVTQILSKSSAITRTTVLEERQRLLEEQKRLTRDQNYVEDTLAAVAGFAKDPKLTAAVQVALRLQADISWARRSRKENWLKDTTERLKHDLEKLKRDLQAVKQQLDQLAEVEDDLAIVRWNESHMCNPLTSSAKMLEAEGLITILERRVG